MDAYEKKELIDKMSKYMQEQYEQEDKSEDEYFEMLKANEKKD